jgi:SAM-dependent methyltransferase
MSKGGQAGLAGRAPEPAGRAQGPDGRLAIHLAPVEEDAAGNQGRDVAADFYVEVLSRLKAEGTLASADSVLVVCGGPLDARALAEAGFGNVTLTNLDPGAANGFQDAENLSFPDGAFDLVVVHAGLHHCHSPHRALLEMYRVARKCALAFEARDSFLMRLAVRLGFTVDHELEAVSQDFVSGGVANSAVPNFVYRWTEREVEKTVWSYDPAAVPKLRFFYGLRLPLQRLENTGSTLRRLVARALAPLAGVFAKLAPRQGNQFAFAIIKTGVLRPWMETPKTMSRAWVEQNRRLYVAR